MTVYSLTKPTRARLRRFRLYQGLVILAILLLTASPSFPRQPYPWETALQNQLQQLNRIYNGIPQDVIVVHMGITGRDDQAYDIARSLTTTLGKPVIALPSYSGKFPPADALRVTAQYLASAPYQAHFDKAWGEIVGEGHRIVGTVFHSGAGVRANADRRELTDFIRNNPGKVEGNVVFAMTDMAGRTKKAFEQVGLNAVQIGKDDMVSWLTKPGQRYIPFGEYIGRLGAPLGWGLKFNPVTPALYKSGITKHGLLDRPDELKNALQTSAPTSSTPSQDTGGIDFSSIELRYLSELDANSRYMMGTAFRGIPASPGQGKDLKQMSELSWNALFIWLALPSDTFWVNLNPEEPDRIIDKELGKTDVGRILLEADFQLKKDIAQLTHPKNSKLGSLYWFKLEKYIRSNPMLNQNKGDTPIAVRVWIVPGLVDVWATDQSIYIADARMEVKLESEYLGEKGRGTRNPVTSKIMRYAETLLKTMILPGLQEKIDTGPKYQELRQVFYSRVIAEWYKTKHRSSKLSFANIMGRGNTDPWRSSKIWSAYEIFQRYKQSYENHEYSVTIERESKTDTHTYRTQRHYFWGGVDFIKLPTNEISYNQLETQKPEIQDEIFNALLTPSGHWNKDGEVWLGGIYAGSIAGSAPAPTPSIPSPTPRPTSLNSLFAAQLSFINAFPQSSNQPGQEKEVKLISDTVVRIINRELTQIQKRWGKELVVNEHDHKIPDTYKNVDDLTGIIFDEFSSPKDKIEKIINSKMIPNKVDIIITGQYIYQAGIPVITIRPIVIIRSSKKILTESLRFKKSGLLKYSGNKVMLYPGAEKIITGKVKDFLRKLHD